MRNIRQRLGQRQLVRLGLLRTFLKPEGDLLKLVRQDGKLPLTIVGNGQQGSLMEEPVQLHAQLLQFLPAFFEKEEITTIQGQTSRKNTDATNS